MRARGSDPRGHILARGTASEIIGWRMPPQPLHPESSLSSAKLENLRKQSTQSLIDSLKPGQPGSLKVRPDAGRDNAGWTPSDQGSSRTRSRRRFPRTRNHSQVTLPRIVEREPKPEVEIELSHLLDRWTLAGRSGDSAPPSGRRLAGCRYPVLAETGARHRRFSADAARAHRPEFARRSGGL